MFRRREDIQSEIAFLSDIYDADREKIFDHLYGNLSIIDSKSASLLTFKAIGLAAISVWLGYVPANELHFYLDIIFILFLVSCVFCLLAVFLYWSSHRELKDANIQPGTLLSKRYNRTIAYRFGWSISLVCWRASWHIWVPYVWHISQGLRQMRRGVPGDVWSRPLGKLRHTSLACACRDN